MENKMITRMIEMMLDVIFKRNYHEWQSWKLSFLIGVNVCLLLVDDDVIIEHSFCINDFSSDWWSFL